MSEEQNETNLTAKGESLPKAASKSGGTEPERIHMGERATVRYRPQRANLRVAGIAIALFALLGALIFCCVAGARGMGNPDETTAESADPLESENGGNEVVDLYAFDPSLIPTGHIGFRPLDLSGDVSELLNESDRTFDFSALLSRYKSNANSSSLSFSEPLVLILHTHTTEGYSPSGAISWDGNGELARTDGRDGGVSSVGEVLAEALINQGIPTLHARELHDADENGVPTYSGSYDRSAATVRRYLAEYPSIKYVIDLHRDAVLDENGNVIRAVTEVNGAAVAQTMTVVGSGEGYDWESNLALALAFSEAMNKAGVSLCRPPVLKASDHGQSLAAHSLLLEIGTAANSQVEAENAARLIAPILAQLIRTVEAAEGA